MPKLNISKTISINKKPEEVLQLLNNFNNWQLWSPWLVLEKEAKVNVSDDGKFYEWDGAIVGAGNMTVLSEEEGKIDYDLTFLKPWKSQAKVGFIVEPEGEGTKVTWTMNSKLPFFMFFMKKMFETFVGMDYDRGLLMLKDMSEDGKVHSELNMKGYEEFGGCTYIGIHRTCSIGEIGKHMQQDYEKLMPYIMEKHSEKVAGHAFSIYHKWNPVKDRVVYTAAVPVSEVPSDLPQGVKEGKVAATKVHVVHHKGPYRHVGNAWSAQMMRQRGKVFKSNKKMYPMEVYLNSPKDTTENDLESEIWLPVK